MLNVGTLTKEVLECIKFNTIRTNKKVTYLNIESSFDIETSSVTVGEEKSAFMYIFMFGIGFENEVYYGRTWEEAVDMFKLLQATYQLNEHRRLVVYIHNFSYEFQFMRKYFEWLDVFTVGDRKPIRALCSYGIEFRDSYILSGYSLEKTAENLQFHKVDKKVGDLDYKLVRTPLTELTPEEMGYCENDIRVVNAYIKEQIMQYGDVNRIPMTNTGRVRSFVRDNCYYTNKNHAKTSRGKFNRYRAIMNDLTLTSEQYVQMKRAFSGGYTHANSDYVGATLENVASIDFTSSYPAVMLSEQFPMSRGKEVEIETMEQFHSYNRDYCTIFDVIFTNIKARQEVPDHYLSESKCYMLKDPVIDNGRIQGASELATTLTNVDFEIVQQCYEWESIAINKFTRFHKGYLPKAIIESIIKLYEDKTVLKGVEGKEVEYMLSKGMLNSVYGMCVTDIIQDSHAYNGAWGTKEADIETEIEKYNTSINRFLYYAWGLFVTAYARKNLWTGIIAMGEDYVYSDTDSIKCLNFDNHQDYIEFYNQHLLLKLEVMCEHHNLDVNKLKPKNQKGVEKPIGVWDFEGTYDKFKTLGAKRYLVEEKGEFQLTVAGLSKKFGMEHMVEQCESNSDKIFEMFTDELYIPSHATGKMTHTYIDDEMVFSITDYKGQECEIETKSGIHLEECEFTLSLSEKYIHFLKNFTQGYVYEGVKYA